MSTAAWRYVGGIIGTAVLVTGVSAFDARPTVADWQTMAALLVLAILAQLFKAEAPNHVLFYATPVFLFAGIILLPAPLVTVLIVVPHLIEWAKERLTDSPHLRRWYLQPFNMAMYTLVATGSQAAIRALDAHSAIPAAPRMLCAAIIGGVVYVLLNHLIMALVLILARGVSWRESGMLDGASLLADFVLPCLGGLVAALWQFNPWLIPLALMPLSMMYQALLIPLLKKQAQTDTKTGLANARYFHQLFAEELQRARRFYRPLAVVMGDLDHFKAINDTYGHLAGDSVLSAVAGVIRATLRDYDIAGRFGGEEFALVLPETELEQAMAFAERLRLAIATTTISLAGQPAPLTVTISLGVACFPEAGMTCDALTDAADRGVYLAKANGRNRVDISIDATTPRRGPSLPLDIDEINLLREPTQTPAQDLPSSAAGLPTPDPASPPLPTPVPASSAIAHDAAHLSQDQMRSAPQPATQSDVPVSVAPPAPSGTPPGGDGQVARHSQSLWLFVCGVVMAGLAITLFGFFRQPLPHADLLALLVLLAVATELLEVELYVAGTISVSVSVLFGTALIAGIPGLACVSLAVALVHHYRQGLRMGDSYRTAFNWATHVLAGSLAVGAIALGGKPTTVHVLPVLVPCLIVAAVGYYLVETVLVATAISLTQRTRVSATWKNQYEWLASHYLALCIVGIALCLGYIGLSDLGIAVFILPAVMMHVTQRQYIMKTRETVQELKRVNQNLIRATLTDHVTGLGNQRAFQEILRRSLSRATPDGLPVVLAVIDVDEFKMINDQTSPEQADHVLISLAGLIKQHHPPQQVFRVDGDEFAVIVPQTPLGAAAEAMEALRSAIEQSLKNVTVSIGIAAGTSDIHDADLLLEKAEAALHEAKRRGRNNLIVFDTIADHVAVTSSAQALAVRRLIANGQIDVRFQPIWDLGASRLLAVEALARPGEEYGLTGPQQAFDIAEQLGRAHDLDSVCRQAILNRARDVPDGALLFLNMSPQTLDHDILNGRTLLDAVHAAGLTPDRIVLELTERSMARLAVVVREARRLRALGFKLALDDTGAGNAGLEMLSKLPVDFVKIDRAVVANAVTDSTARAVIAGIIAIAREIGIGVIVEGIETEAMLDVARQMSAGTRLGVQGYLLGQPGNTIPTSLTHPRLSLLETAMLEKSA